MRLSLPSKSVLHAEQATIKAAAEKEMAAEAKREQEAELALTDPEYQARKQYGLPRKEVLLRTVRLKTEWSKAGFDTVMIANFKIDNPMEYGFKDFEITCTLFGQSGTAIHSNTQRIYEVVGPNSKKTISRQNMGLINSQAVHSRCRITDLVVQ